MLSTLIAIPILAILQPIWWVTILALIFVAFIVSLIWWISRRPPKTPKNKVGFLVGIACDRDDESKKLREDFVIPLRQLIKSGKTGSAFHFMELAQHLARDIIEQDDAQSARLQSRANFLLFGRVRLRPINGQEHHIIDLNGIVSHKPVPDHISQSLAQEFSELFPMKVRISTENDLLSFQFTSEWAAVVAKYIIGIAAACSGDLAYAETLYNDALVQLKQKDQGFPIYQKLNKRLPIRISELYEAKAMVAYQAWVVDPMPSQIEEMGTNLQKAVPSRRDTIPSVLILRAIYVFLKERDARSAMRFLKAIKERNNGLWHYNIAFLYGYVGDLRLAIRHYKEAIKHDVNADVLSQVEEFMCRALQQEPNKFQICYCLGFFNWKAKGDKLQAKKDLTDFVNAGEVAVFKKEKEVAQQWLRELG